MEIASYFEKQLPSRLYLPRVGPVEAGHEVEVHAAGVESGFDDEFGVLVKNGAEATE